MSAVHSKGSEAEVALRQALSGRSLRYRLHVKRAAGEPLIGRPDIVFVRARVIVFVDSDFWHGRILKERGLAALRSQFRPTLRRWWTAKIAGNVKRDSHVSRSLRRSGWRVCRVWEQQVLRDPNAVAAHIAKIVADRRKKLEMI